MNSRRSKVYRFIQFDRGIETRSLTGIPSAEAQYKQDTHDPSLDILCMTPTFTEVRTYKIH